MLVGTVEFLDHLIRVEKGSGGGSVMRGGCPGSAGHGAADKQSVQHVQTHKRYGVGRDVHVLAW